VDLIELDAMLALYNPRWSVDARALAAFELLVSFATWEIRFALESVIVDPPEPRSLAGIIARIPRS
jgi:hypothetical protein